MTLQRTTHQWWAWKKLESWPRLCLYERALGLLIQTKQMYITADWRPQCNLLCSRPTTTTKKKKTEATDLTTQAKINPDIHYSSKSISRTYLWKKKKKKKKKKQYSLPCWTTNQVYFGCQCPSHWQAWTFTYATQSNSEPFKKQKNMNYLLIDDKNSIAEHSSTPLNGCRRAADKTTNRTRNKLWEG